MLKSSTFVILLWCMQTSFIIQWFFSPTYWTDDNFDKYKNSKFLCYCFFYLFELFLRTLKKKKNSNFFRVVMSFYFIWFHQILAKSYRRSFWPPLCIFCFPPKLLMSDIILLCDIYSHPNFQNSMCQNFLAINNK